MVRRQAQIQALVDQITAQLAMIQLLAAEDDAESDEEEEEDPENLMGRRVRITRRDRYRG